MGAASGAPEEFRTPTPKFALSGYKLKSNRPAPSSALTSTADITHQGCEVRSARNGLLRRVMHLLGHQTRAARGC
jgi:hypothetical protein